MPSRQVRIGPALLGLAIVTGLALRLAPIMLADFPLRDGGLFVTMAHDIRNAGFVLPEFSTYNTGEVPFAYPPLGLYILALIPGDPISTERWLPLVWSMAAIPGAYLLARALIDERRAGLAALIFAAMPVAWAIEGGGVTRALAFALLLFGLWRIAAVLKTPGVRDAALAGILAGAAILAHPAVAPAGVASAALLFVVSPSRRGFAALVGGGLVAAAVVAPWLTMTLIRYGPESLLTAALSHQEDALGRLLTFGPSWIGTLDFVLPLALLGVAIVSRRRQWLLPAWVLLMIVVPGGEGRYAAVAWAMLAATGAALVADAVAPRQGLKVAAGIGFAWLFLASLGAGYYWFSAIPAGVRDAMVTIAREVPPTTRFAVVSDSGGLEHSMLDWFPTLSGRVSVGTFMGLEWTTAARWDQAVALSHRIQRGEIPASADYVFTAEGNTATWAPAR